MTLRRLGPAKLTRTDSRYRRPGPHCGRLGQAIARRRPGRRPARGASRTRPAEACPDWRYAPARPRTQLGQSMTRPARNSGKRFAARAVIASRSGPAPAPTMRATTDDHGRTRSGWSAMKVAAASRSISELSASQSIARRCARMSRKACYAVSRCGYSSCSSVLNRRKAPLPSIARSSLRAARSSVIPAAKSAMSWYHT
jgi:hypothetical protein